MSFSGKMKKTIEVGDTRAAYRINLNSELCSIKWQCAQILATAVIRIADKNRKERECITLLDGDSQSNFMTSLCQRLNLATTKANIPIISINRSKTNIVESVVATIRSKHKSLQGHSIFLLLHRITDDLSSELINPDSLYQRYSTPRFIPSFINRRRSIYFGIY